MRVRVSLVALLFSLASGLSFGAEGIFQGTVVDPPASQPASPGWIFVEGGNHLLRKVEVTHAVIVFGPQVPPSRKRKCGPECLSAGQEVRVTAEQDASGEWRARQVEILRTADRRSGLTAEVRRDGLRLPGRAGLSFVKACSNSGKTYQCLCFQSPCPECLDNQRALAEHLIQHGEIPQDMVIRGYNDQV
jgi:hypothetical protein